MTCARSLGHAQADVDTEQDGGGEDGPSALDAELYVARPSGRRAMEAYVLERASCAVPRRPAADRLFSLL